MGNYLPGSADGPDPKSTRYSMSMNELPEELKIREYEALVDKLSASLARIEEENRSLDAELTRFQGLYFSRLGHLFLYNDILDAAVRAEEARRNPTPENTAAAHEAQERLRENREGQQDRGSAEEVAITSELKNLYREVIQVIHPARASDEWDRLYRVRVTEEVNAAFAKGDEKQIQRLRDEFQQAPMPNNVGKRLILLIRQQYDLRKHIEERRKALEELQTGEQASFRAEFAENEKHEEDAFAVLAKELQERILENTRKAAALSLVPTGFTRFSS